MANLLDANAILRYLIDDIPDQASAAEAAIEGRATVISDVIAECTHVLCSPRLYGISRRQASTTLLSFLDLVSCEDEAIVRRALEIMGSEGLDYVDSLLAARSELRGDRVVTFDKKLLRLLNGRSA